MTFEQYIAFAEILASSLLVPALAFRLYAISYAAAPHWGQASWATTFLLAAAALSALHTLIPPFGSVLLSNLLVGLGYVYAARATRSVRHLPPWTGLLLVALLGYAAACIFNFMSDASYGQRATTVSAGIAVFSALILSSALADFGRTNRMGEAVIALCAAMNIAVSAVRIEARLNLPGIPGLPVGMADSVFFSWSIVAVFAFSTGIFAIGNAAIHREAQRLMQEKDALARRLQGALDRQKNLKQVLLHEVKRPLNSIFATTQTLTPAEGQQAQVVQLLAQCTQAIQSLRHLGSADEVEEIVAKPDFRTLPVADLMKDIQRRWTVPVRQGGVAGQTIRVDPLLFEIAVDNLIENARRHGGDCTGVALSMGEASLHVDVHDAGAGIPPDLAERVWEQFFRADPAAVAGWGLGLHLVRQIVTAHGGTARVLSQSPSVIRMSLPIKGPMP